MGVYRASDYVAWRGALVDVSGRGNHAYNYGDVINSASGSGNGVSESIQYIYGGTGARLRWPAYSDWQPEQIKNKITICAVTRYTDSDSQYQERILTDKVENFYFGHEDGKRGVMRAVGGMKTADQTQGTSTDWLFMCGQNKNSNDERAVIVDGKCYVLKL